MNTRAKIGLGLLGLLVVLFLLWYLGVFDEFLNKDDEDSKKKNDEGGAPEAPNTGGPPSAAPAVTPVVTPVVTTVSQQELAVGDWTPITVKLPVSTVNQNAASALCRRSAEITNPGYPSPHNGWYDTENCGIPNRYCRWIGDQAGDYPPAEGTYQYGRHGESIWVCSTPTDELGYYPETWSANYLRSDTEQYYINNIYN